MIIYGKNTVLEAMRQQRPLTKIYLSEHNKTFQKQLNDYGYQTTPLSVMSFAKMNQQFKGNHQGIVAEILGEYHYKTLKEIIKKAEGTTNAPAFVILDGLEDPHNLGAILRTADATKMQAVIIPKNRSVGLSATVAKVSTGAIEHVDVVQVTNLVQAINELKQQGFWIIGLELDGSIDYRQQDYHGKIVLVIGSEGRGISRLVKEACDFTVNIPMYGHVNSLNASVSAAILFYEVVRSRQY